MKSYLPDVLMLIGVGAVSYGASLVYWPAGFIVAGVFLILGGVLIAKTKGE